MLDDETARVYLTLLKQGCELAERGQILYEIGDYYRELGFLDLALQHLRKSQELRPGRWRTFLALGRSYFDQGNLREAQPNFQETQRLVHDHPEPGLPSAEFASASAYEHIADILGRHRPADQFSAVAGFYQQAALLYDRAGDQEAAARCRLRLSVGARPEEAGLARQGQLMLELGYRSYPHNAEIACRLGTLYRAQGADRRALRCYLRAARLDSPWRAQARQAAAEALGRLGILPEQRELLA
ncbi:MAG: hypothetical protein U0931_38600 [Vulcanimicrobiota bacterium]